jgi:hypothetical protein
MSSLLGRIKASPLWARRFGLQPLPGARAQMGDLTAAFDFSQ